MSKIWSSYSFSSGASSTRNSKRTGSSWAGGNGTPKLEGSGRQMRGESVRGLTDSEAGSRNEYVELKDQVGVDVRWSARNVP